jgi:hypothetical protein
MMRIPSIALGVAIVGLASAPPLRGQDLSDLDPATRTALEEIRAATEKYQDPEAALADGYIREPMNLCAMAADEGLPAELGGMGIHYFRPDLLGITGTEPRVSGTGMHTDFLQPSILVYYPDDTGTLKLGAVENLVWEGAWRGAGNESPPAYHGHPYTHRVDDPATEGVDEAHLFEPHYELHVWLYEDNPAGLFAQYNPRVGCDHHDGPKTMAEAIAQMKAHPPAGGGTQP